ncbi:MFS1 putative major facilitator superfamily transporter [Neohortaea acidophila]|uniref:MFS1 putative major facilitator superfamily transporter n=1 Tax=Neohortaea acidophila TaxID=245834 RepID=A0A6A6PV39_9PEZI|nr:MFS1 putative major facilitator superfamily transporter [Neohortaea acidophila]KAF2483998.1 MFS1 putative major facilitator superfamily transporter [Neohortaea acidophila]
MAPYFGLTGRKLHAAVWIISWVAVSMFGYNGAAAGGVLNSPAFQKQFPSIDVETAPPGQAQHRSTIQGTVVATFTLLGTVGALGCIWVGDILGRRKTLFLACSINLIGAILIGTAYSLAQFVVARVFLGIGVGGIISTIPAWQSELSRAESRGSHVSSFGIYCGTGLSLALWLAYGLSFTTGEVTWRLPVAGGGVLAVIVMTFIFFLPESPRWLKLKDRHEEARRVLEALHPGDPDTINKEIEDIELALKLSVKQASLKYMFTMGPQRVFHRVMLACIVQIMLQFTGVNAIAYYTPTIYANNLHFPAVEAGALAAASQAMIILGGIICSFTVDRFGRRLLMLVSAAGMSICLAIVTGLTSNGSPAASKAAVVFLYLYYIVYTLGFIGIPFLYASEIAPVQLRAPICGLSTGISWVFNFLVVEITPVGFTTIGYRYFIIYAVFCASFVPIVYFFYPETAGRSLEEIDAIFVEATSIWDVVSVAKKMPKHHLAEHKFDQKIVEQLPVEDKEPKLSHGEESP